MPGTTIQPDTDNRLLSVLLMHTAQEIEHLIKNPHDRRDDANAVKMEKKHYQSVAKRFKGDETLSPEEKATLQYVNHKNRQHRAKDLPLIARLGYRLLNATLNVLLRRKPNFDANRDRLAKQEQAMITGQNYHMLLSELNSRGFNKVPEQVLKEFVTNQLPSFSLRYADDQIKDANYILHFEKHTNGTTYNWTGFDAIARTTNPDGTARNTEQMQMQFANSQEVKFTPLEAANLVNGRAVRKESYGYAQWYHPKMGATPIQTNIRYNDTLQKLDHLPVKGWENNVTKQNILNAFYRGEKVALTLAFPGIPDVNVLGVLDAKTNHIEIRTPDDRPMDLKRYTDRLLQVSTQVQQTSQLTMHPFQHPKL